MQTLPLNQKTLDSLQAVLKIAGYTIRYEKGSFNNGFCILDNTKTLVINKFSTLDTKINVLSTTLVNTSIDLELVVDDKLKKVLHTLQQTKLKL